jgi:hypothetical protein
MVRIFTIYFSPTSPLAHCLAIAKSLRLLYFISKGLMIIKIKTPYQVI